MANHKFQLRDPKTGQIFHHAGLVQRKFFTSPRAVRDFIVDNVGCGLVVLDSLGQELPHFFSEYGMYAVRHKKGMLYSKASNEGALWCKRICDVCKTFDEDPRRQDGSIPELETPQQWYVVDQFLRLATPGLERFFKVPDKPGRWALMRKIGGMEGLVKRSNGKYWFATLNGLKRFATSGDLMFTTERTGNQVFMNARKGFRAVRSLGDGEYEELPDVDLFL